MALVNFATVKTTVDKLPHSRLIRAKHLMSILAELPENAYIVPAPYTGFLAVVTAYLTETEYEAPPKGVVQLGCIENGEMDWWDGRNDEADA